MNEAIIPISKFMFKYAPAKTGRTVLNIILVLN